MTAGLSLLSLSCNVDWILSDNLLTKLVLRSVKTNFLELVPHLRGTDAMFESCPSFGVLGHAVDCL